MALLLVFLLAGTGGSWGAHAPAVEEGAVAPLSTWYTRGGCMARTAAALTPGLEGPLEAAWELPLSGPIEGEPLVWNELVVVETRDSERERSLQVVHLLSGRVLARERFRTELPLQPSLWNRVVVVRSGPTELSALRLFPSAVQTFFRWRLPAPVHAPLLVEDEVFARVGDAVWALRLWRSEPAWQAPGTFRGSPSVRMGVVYAVAYTGAGMARLFAMDARTGQVVDAVVLAHHGGSVPAPDAPLSIAVHEQSVFVYFPLGVPLSGGGTANCAHVHRSHASGPLRLVPEGLFHVQGELVEVAGGWIGQVGIEEDQPMLVRGRGLEDPQPLASPDHHPEVLTLPSLPARAGNALYLGRHGVELERSRILWSLPQTPTGRLVPARETVLVPDGARLVALRSAAAERRAPRLCALPEPAADGTGRLRGRAVLRDGTVFSGEFQAVGSDVEAGELLLRAPGRRERVPWRDVLVVESPEGELWYVGPDELALRGLDLLLEHDLAAHKVEQMKRSMDAGEPGLLARLLAEAVARGSEDWRAVNEASARLERLEEVVAEGRTLRVRRDVVQEILDQEAELLTFPARFRWQRAAQVPEATPWDLRLDLLRAVLEADETHREAVALVKALLPAGMGTPRSFSALDWLDFVEAARHVEVEVVDPERPGQLAGVLERARREWRADVLGIRTRDLCVVTPLGSPGRISRCLATGELVCRTLEELFGGGAQAEQPLVLYLYESAQEYQAASRENGQALEWTLGHYSPRERLARVYLPEEEDAFAAVLPTYVHELTHQWVYERCPSGAPARMQGDLRGFWIVEGLASMVESWRFHVRRRTRSSVPLPEALDVVANAQPQELVPWTALFHLTQAEFSGLSKDPDRVVGLSRYLGVGRHLSASGMFYVQAEAACHFLFEAENGRHRAALLRLVADWYSGAADRVAVQTAFGLGEEELGRRILAYARARQQASR